MIERPPAAEPGRRSFFAELTHDRVALLILAGSLLLRMLVVAGFANTDIKIEDERHYHELAGNLRDGNGFVLHGTVTSLRPPLYPAFVAVVWTAVGGESLTAVRIAQSVLSVLTCIPAYYLALVLFNRRAARWALAGVALYPSLVFADALILTEVLFTFLLMLTAAAAASLVHRPRFLTAAALGAAVAATALTRSVLWPFPLVLVPLVAWAVPGALSRKVLLSATVFVGYAVVIAPWSIRNTQLQHSFTVVDTMGGMNLRMGNYEHTPDDRMWAVVGLDGDKNWSHELALERGSGAAPLTEGQKEKWARDKAVDYMLHHPLVTARRSLIRFADFWGLEREFAAAIAQGIYQPPRWFGVLVAIAMGLAYPIVMLLAVVGVFMVPLKDLRTHAFLFSLVAFICMVHTVVFGHSRYHLPLIPILLVYAAAAIDWLSHASRLPARTWTPVLVAASILCLIWIRQVFAVDADRLHQLLQVLS